MKNETSRQLKRQQNKNKMTTQATQACSPMVVTNSLLHICDFSQMLF